MGNIVLRENGYQINQENLENANNIENQAEANQEVVQEEIAPVVNAENAEIEGENQEQNNPEEQAEIDDDMDVEVEVEEMGEGEFEDIGEGEDMASSSSDTEEEKIPEGEEITTNGCSHYPRNCELYCHQCDKFFVCRFCHDEFWDSNFKEIKKHHAFDRFNVQKIKCIKCSKIQEPKETCEDCGILFAKYSCLKCNFYDDKGLIKKAFHCDGCKICRVGGRENYFHCDICNACLGLALRDSHECGDFSQNCPVCFENFHSVRDSGIILKCKHVVHSKCYKSMMKAGNYSCPMCKKSTLDDANTELLNAAIQNQIDSVQMGEAGEKDVKIICNECGEKSTMKFHIVAHKCPSCNSFNTALD